MAIDNKKRDTAAADRRAHAELQGRGSSEGVTKIKKGSRMPASGKQPTLPFVVAHGVKMGVPSPDKDGKQVATGGETVHLTKAQAEWCMANGFIDSILPDFGPTAAVADGSGEAQASAGSSPEGEGVSHVHGGASSDNVQEARESVSRRKASTL